MNLNTLDWLIVLGMPCNDFNEREPLEGDELDAHYWETHRVNFPVTEKLDRGYRPIWPVF